MESLPSSEESSSGEATPSSSSSQEPSGEASSSEAPSSESVFSEEPSSEYSGEEPSSEESSEVSSETSSSEESSEPSSETSSGESSATSRYDRNPSDESMFGKQKYLQYIGNIEDVWEEYRGDGVTMAIIDGGFRTEHPEFQFENGTSKILSSSASFTYNGSKVSVAKGVDKVGITDGDSHGTICATVAAGSITGEGTVGVAPNCNLMLLKVDKKPQSICEAFRYAADNGAKVLTISIGSYYDGWGDLNPGGTDLSKAFDEATRYAHKKGMVICSAGGNGGEDASHSPTEYTYPSASDYVIGVGGLAYASRSAIWSGSSYNSSKDYQFCDVFAPGENLYSGCYFDRDGKHYDYDGGFNGTSFASPIVAGAAALYFDKYPTATNTDFERALFNTASPLQGEKGGYGAIDIKALMDYKKPDDAEKTFYFKDASWWRADSAKTSVFAWNYAQTQVSGDYPGIMMESLSSDTWSITLDTTLYDRLVFTRVSPSNVYWGAETVNIDLSSFGNKNGYSIASTSPAWKNDHNYAKGTFFSA